MESLDQDPLLLQEFLTECEELLQSMDQDLVELESAPENEELLNRIFRALHTIKGTSGFLGFDPIVQLSHHAEDVLSSLRRREIPLTPRIMNVLLAVRDQLGKMLADIRGGGLQQYAMSGLLTELEIVQSQSNAPLPLGELLVREGQIKPEDLAHVLQKQAASPDMKLGEIVVEQGLASAEDVERALAQQKKATPGNTSSQTMRVDVRKLDELVNLIGELVLERNRLLQLAKELSDSRFDMSGSDSPLGHSTARLRFITDELQAAGLRTRMVPIETVFCKFPRLVRDLARSLQKEVELVMHGQETEIDKTMVELISDPLVHLVRNSLDHGFELPADRESAGKPRRGTLRLEALQEGDHIIIAISDDGAGIDPARILRKAIEKGLVTAQRAGSLGRRETLDFIFLPGFSTAESATNLSGRGVGMDVVRSNLKKVNGSVELQSVTGKGTTLLLHLPLTLAILPVLLVQVADETYALPLRSIVETARFTASNVHPVEGREVVCLRDETLPLLRLQSLFSSPGVDAPAKERKIVVMAVGDLRIALLVDRLVGQESTVVKPLASYLHHCPGIAGATVGGDGRVRLVLDPAGLIGSASPLRQGVLQ
jgi:two-component system chemotaxis sensor kinase CheA